MKWVNRSVPSAIWVTINASVGDNLRKYLSYLFVMMHILLNASRSRCSKTYSAVFSLITGRIGYFSSRKNGGKLKKIKRKVIKH